MQNYTPSQKMGCFLQRGISANAGALLCRIAPNIYAFQAQKKSLNLAPWATFSRAFTKYGRLFQECSQKMSDFFTGVHIFGGKPLCLFSFPGNWVFRHVSLLAVVRGYPLEADGDTGLAAGGAGEEGQVPVAGGHGFLVVWVQGLLLHHLKGDHLVVHIRKEQGIPGLEGFEPAEMGSVVVGADDEIILVQRT